MDESTEGAIQVATGVQASQPAGSFAWTKDLVERARNRVALGLPSLQLGPPSMPEGPAPTPTRGTGYDRAPLDGITLDRPLDAAPTFLTNLVEHATGIRDERSGRALGQVALAGQQLVQAGLHSAAAGKGVIAAGSSVLGKVLPTIGVGAGLLQVWKGWNELQSHDEGIFSLIHSRTARTGILQTIASALLFVPGFGTAIGGAALRIGAAANEMDAFSSLDWKTVRVEDQGERIARRVHVLDRTPTDAHDGVLAARRAAAAARTGAQLITPAPAPFGAPVPPG